MKTSLLFKRALSASALLLSSSFIFATGHVQAADYPDHSVS